VIGGVLSGGWLGDVVEPEGVCEAVSAGRGEAHDPWFGHPGDPGAVDQLLAQCGAERACEVRAVL
jgi:hypothetical protein